MHEEVSHLVLFCYRCSFSQNALANLMRNHCGKMENAETQANIIRLNWSDRYSDVIFQGEDRSFKCRRLILSLVLEYFCEMFQIPFRENRPEKVALGEIEAPLFAQGVLNFICTGHVVITESNFFDMLRAGDRFRLTGIETMCVEYIQSNMSRLFENLPVFEIFAFVRTNGIGALIDVFCDYIRKQIDYLYLKEDFLEINFEELKMILWSSLRLKDQNAVLNATFRWIRQAKHSPDDRGNYFSQLKDSIDFESVCSKFKYYVVKQCCKPLTDTDNGSGPIDAAEYEDCSASFDISKYIDISEYESSPRDLLDNLFDLPEERPDSPTLHIFVNSFNSSDMVTNVIRLQKHKEDFDWTFSCGIHPPGTLKAVQLNDLLYYLKRTATNSTLSFGVTSSVSLYPTEKLNDPIVNVYNVPTTSNSIFNTVFPNMNDHFDLCGMKNSIYLYEKYSGCIHEYNCERNAWSTSSSIQKVNNACLISDNECGLLYLVGGCTEEDVTGRSKNFVRIHDPRTNEWTNGGYSEGAYENAASCFHKGKLYASGGIHNQTMFEKYDPIAGSWHSLTPMNFGKENHRLVSYDNYLWAISTCFQDSNIEYYFEKKDEWRRKSPFDRILEEYKMTRKNKSLTKDFIVDGIVYKP